MLKTASHAAAARLIVVLAMAIVWSERGLQAQAVATGPLRVRVTIDPSLGAVPVSGRLLVFMTSDPKQADVIAPDVVPSDGFWIAAREVSGLTPGAVVEVGADADASPGPLSIAPRGRYQLMALLDVDHNANYTTLSANDLRSPVVQTDTIDPSATPPVDLRISVRVPAPTWPPHPDADPVTLLSPSLSNFWGRPVHIRALVIRPPGYRESRERYPTVYVTHGFTGTLEQSPPFTELVTTSMAKGTMPPMIWVLLEQVVAGGTHEFADGVNNGPVGQALTRELVPYLEHRYRMDARPRGRLLTGHSSGGWATAWLQVTYPDVFGGTWSTSPDPVDFHEFVNVDLYADTNFYRTPQGTPRSFMRGLTGDQGYLERFSKRELVLGEYGGQMASFEWVFSPRGPDGRPMRLYDRSTGTIDRTVADFWIVRYDIARLLVSGAPRLARPLHRKLHFVVGTADNFFLDVPLRRLQETLKPLGYDATFTYLANRDHFNLFDDDLMAQIAMQMYEAARPTRHWRPTAALNPATVLAK